MAAKVLADEDYRIRGWGLVDEQSPHDERAGAEIITAGTASRRLRIPPLPFTVRPNGKFAGEGGYFARK